MEKLIITACLTGAEVTKEQQPNLPITPDEIAEAAYECFLAGASMVHVHARDEEGTLLRTISITKKSKKKLKLSATLYSSHLPAEQHGTHRSKECSR